jgi:hypothetical protein
MFEDNDIGQKALGIIFIVLGPVIFSITVLHPGIRTLPTGLVVILGLVSVATSVLGILILRYEIVYIIVRIILPED